MGGLCARGIASIAGKTIVKLSSAPCARGLNGPFSARPGADPLAGGARDRDLIGLMRGLFVLEVRPDPRIDAAESGRMCGPPRFEGRVCRGGLGTGLRGGVSAFSLWRLAYRSAVAGRGTSGLRGRRMGADDSDPCPAAETEEARAGRVGAFATVALGGAGRLRAVLTVEGVGRTTEEGASFTGENVDMADVGLSGARFAASDALR